MGHVTLITFLLGVFCDPLAVIRYKIWQL